MNNTINAIVSATKAKGNITQSPLLVAVCGGTATGKSTIITQSIVKSVGKDVVNVVEMDNFQRGRESKHLFVGKYGHDTPEYFEVEECVKAVKLLKEKQSVVIPVYNYGQGRQTAHVTLHQKPVIIVEGLFAAYDELANLADIIVYAESTMYGRLLRRIFRNRYERYSVNAVVSFTNFFSTLNAHDNLIAPQKNGADCAIFVPYKFEDSIKRFSLTPLGDTQMSQTMLYQFSISNNTTIGVYNENEALYFTLLYNNMIYLDFEITKQQFALVTELDFNSL